MNFAELIYRLAEFFFDCFWHFIALEIFILTLQGGFAKIFIGIGGFVKKTKANYKAKVDARRQIVEMKKPKIMTDLESNGKSKD